MFLISLYFNRCVVGYINLKKNRVNSVCSDYSKISRLINMDRFFISSEKKGLSLKETYSGKNSVDSM